jgi:hypothetical protein
VSHRVVTMKSIKGSYAWVSHRGVTIKSKRKKDVTQGCHIGVSQYSRNEKKNKRLEMV